MDTRTRVDLITHELANAGCSTRLRNEIIWCAQEREHYSPTGADTELLDRVDRWLKSNPIHRTAADYIIECVTGWSGDTLDRELWLLANE